jgi:medium-chain acyl-[acyl-carrier-protein] hydrolase
VFRAWPEHLDERIEIRSITLPGRERRFAEPALDSVEALVEGLLPAVLRVLDSPFAIFGHSLGAMVAFELAHRLTARGQPPLHLLASAARSPHRARSGPPFHLSSDVEFLETVCELGGTPPELVANQEFMQMMLPILRLDFTAAETYRHPPIPLPCPITVYGGSTDNLIDPDDLEGWSSHTSKSCSVHVLPGGHSFITASRAELLRLIDQELAAYLD